jgi:hypothetical protein
MVINVTDYIRHVAMESPLLMSSYKGEMPIPDNSPVVKYPYLNIDVLSTDRTDYHKEYKFRIWVCDRNDVYIAYSKCEQIIIELMAGLAIDVYKYEYFKNDYQDGVHGCFIDFGFLVDKDCVELPNFDYEITKYRIENGVYIKN